MKTLSAGVAAVVAAIIASLWLFGFWSAPPPAISAPEERPAPAMPQMPRRVATVEDAAAQAVNQPVIPAVPLVREPSRVPLPVVDPAAEQAIRQQAQAKAITNNLRNLATAMQIYMLENGVSQASYYDVVGTSTDALLRPITPVAGEVYEVMVLSEGTQIQVTTGDGRTITYNL